MEIQYVLDPYAFAAYKVSCITKWQGGMSNLLSNACREAKETPTVTLSMKYFFNTC